MTARLGRRSAESVRARSLMERIRSDDLQERIGGDPFSNRIESIKANLVRVLNARAGGAASSPWYGLGDLNDASVGSMDMLGVIARDIRRAIEVGDPRVRDVQVDFERRGESGTELFFKISANTSVSHQRQQVSIDLILTGGRQFKLR